jgi:hypothetical protein
VLPKSHVAEHAAHGEERVVVPKVRGCSKGALKPTSQLTAPFQPYVLTRFRRWRQTFGRFTLFVILTATGAFLYGE